MKPVMNADVVAVFESYPPKPRRKLLVLRKLILETAAATAGVGVLEETLKWGEPAYLTSQSRSGSTIRIGWKPSNPSRYAIYFNCQTNLVERFRELFPDCFQFEGDRSIVFEVNDSVPVEPLSFCIAAALTYHRDKKSLRS